MTPEEIRQALNLGGCPDGHGCNCAGTCLCGLVEEAVEAAECAYERGLEDAAKVVEGYSWLAGIAAAIRALKQKESE
jgi:hypothetical protein